jgi:hypothetical protein
MRQLGNLMCAGMAAVVMGSANLPTGPSVMVLPAAGKPFEQFQAQDTRCRQWIARQVGLLGLRETENAVLGAVTSTALGAAVGAATIAASHHAGAGAAIGAGIGLLGGTLAGATGDQEYIRTAQRRYDMAYQQCMYAYGNKLPNAVPSTGHAGTPPPPPELDADAPVSDRLEALGRESRPDVWEDHTCGDGQASRPAE